MNSSNIIYIVRVYGLEPFNSIYHLLSFIIRKLFAPASEPHSASGLATDPLLRPEPNPVPYPQLRPEPNPVPYPQLRPEPNSESDSESHSELNHEFYTTEWSTIKRVSSKGCNRMLAVILAYRLLEHAFTKCGFDEKSLHKNLKLVSNDLTRKKYIWEGKKLRNEIVHDVERTSITKEEMRQALTGVHQVLKDIGALPKD